MKNSKKAISIRNLSYTFSDRTEALKNVSLDIMKGENVALVGANGAGKSTLLAHLNGIIKKQRGNIEIMGNCLTEKKLVEIRKRLGLVFQDPEDQLFMATVFDDIAFGPINMGVSRTEVGRRVRSALKKVGLENYEERCPHHLSFGEKKRIGVATALSMMPDILLLDEPTSNLDPLAKRNMIDMLKKIRGTKIIASHDIEMLLDICDRAVVLDRGEIVANGKAEDILCDVDLLRKHGLDAPTVVKIFGKDGIKIIKKQVSADGLKDLKLVSARRYAKNGDGIINKEDAN